MLCLLRELCFVSSGGKKKKSKGRNRNPIGRMKFAKRRQRSFSLGLQLPQCGVAFYPAGGDSCSLHLRRTPGVNVCYSYAKTVALWRRRGVNRLWVPLSIEWLQLASGICRAQGRYLHCDAGEENHRQREQRNREVKRPSLAGRRRGR